MIHETAIVDEGACIREETKIWQFTHVQDTARIGRCCNIGQNCYIAGYIGDFCKIQNNVSVYKGVILGDGVFVGPSAVFTNVKRPRANKQQPYVTTIVRGGATIGANATIVCGVTIGVDAMIGAGAVVTKDVPAGETWVGNPARKMDVYDIEEEPCVYCFERHGDTPCEPKDKGLFKGTCTTETCGYASYGGCLWTGDCGPSPCGIEEPKANKYQIGVEPSRLTATEVAGRMREHTCGECGKHHSNGGRCSAMDTNTSPMQCFTTKKPKNLRKVASNLFCSTDCTNYRIKSDWCMGTPNDKVPGNCVSFKSHHGEPTAKKPNDPWGSVPPSKKTATEVAFEAQCFNMTMSWAKWCGEHYFLVIQGTEPKYCPECGKELK